MPETNKSRGRKPGPEPERVKTDLSFDEAVLKALGKKRPKDGWPKPESGKTDEKPHRDPDSD